MLDIVIEKETNTNQENQGNNNPSRYNSSLSAGFKFSTYLVFEYCEHDLEGMLIANIKFTLG